jgi:uncharacterized protein (TIGR02145 family)
MSNTARFLWEVTASGGGYTPKDSVSGSRHEVLFVPYDTDERTYRARAKAISNNGSSDSEWSAEAISNPGKYQSWYRITGPTGFDIKYTDYAAPDTAVNGRYRERTRLDSNTAFTYTVETLGGTGTANYQWSIERDETGGLVTLGTDKISATVELIFNENILSKADLVNNPSKADTIVLQCSVDDDRETYTLTRKITVGDRDECSPVAKLLDAEGNDYTVSKFGGVCWMTQNMRSTYTWQGNQKQEISQNRNILNDNNAISYYYPSSYTSKTNPAAYGLLYTWGAANIGTSTTEAMNAFPNTTSDRQGICPEGWVIPSDYDWNLLEKEIATHPALYSDQTIPLTWDTDYEIMSGWRPGEGNTITTWWGRSMKSPTTVGTTTNTYGVSKIDGTGFNALLVGSRGSGNAANYGTVAEIWSSSVNSATGAWRRYLGSGYSGVTRTSPNKYYFFSIRCKKI